ncbi:MAG TPA: chemotaxis protein CheW [Clostridium sp.]|jgi:purine-binding chemotaxis protein CheW|uniref:Chemotaxis protein CheW n=1 Tax=Clostridium lapidicellarium TaxID=3240931 RepID=A0ABV4DVL2_9CLOT|nr:chemotaxis protein CheW [uncultured Clostridium sp.]NLU08588.1 purine-binding chemotaxis protein CheW [Clostridiales bacterium]HBC97147.1 chemotaxis protein CheW [Clostridium sp.]
MGNKEIKVLIFSIGDEYYATDIMEIERILGYKETTKLPDSPDFVEGVINYEGNILPIISLSKRFRLGADQKGDQSKIIVTKQDGNKIGVIVDEVSEVRDVKESDIEVPPEIIAGISKRYVKGLIKIDEKIVIFLNMAKILTDKEKELI